jgi:hypothetical protein
LKPLLPTERQLDEAFAAHVRNNPVFFNWVLGRTKFKDLAAELDLHEPWQFRWYRSPLTRLDSETDIFLRFHNAHDKRYALHIENKLGSAKLRALQPEDYRQRGYDQRERWGYQDFATVLIAPIRFRSLYRSECAKFDAFIAHEEIADHIPLFALSH